MPEACEKLGLESARNFYIEGSAVRVQKSTEHFEDINLVGTDVLRKTSIFVNYSQALSSWVSLTKALQARPHLFRRLGAGADLQGWEGHRKAEAQGGWQGA